ncbi:MAG: hypothetical protein MRZ79_20560 [Bacteroidia bacterium]|nr:hypothetical protein [Bacteroidia bacterium]
MKTIYQILSICFVLLSISVQAQNPTQDKFHFLAYGGLGYGIVVNDGASNYNLNSNQGEILVNFMITGGLKIATGVGYNQLSGSGFYAEGNFYHDREVIKIPLLLSYEMQTYEKLKLIVGIGAFGQTIIKDEYQFLNSTQTDAFQGWTFGIQFGASMVYELQDNFSLGLQLNGQSDLSQLETSNSQFFNGSQRIDKLTSIGPVFLFGF